MENIHKVELLHVLCIPITVYGKISTGILCLIYDLFQLLHQNKVIHFDSMKKEFAFLKNNFLIKEKLEN